MTRIISSHLTLNQSTEIKTINMLVKFEKNNVSALKNELNIDDGKIHLPSFCDMLVNLTDVECQNKIITQKVKDFKSIFNI